ncbi:MAG: ADP-ribosylglycohydrolase family protein [Bacteroidota bacterium]
MIKAGTDLLIGVAVGDALGVPYEFKSRESMLKDPAKDIVGYGTHGQPPGTWSDDSSLTFCLAEALLKDASLESAAKKFISWRNEAYWTAHHSVFDIGMTTTQSISRLEKILSNGSLDELELLKYGGLESDNGNGSLMRILPLLFEIKKRPIKEQFEITWKHSALTHRHIRAAMSCMIYLKFAEFILEGNDLSNSYQKMRTSIKDLWNEMDFSMNERQHFKRVIQENICDVSKDEVLSGGYVIESLEASLWCIMKTDSYEDAVLTAINFGHDTDTTGAITGGLAGLYYTCEGIPDYWIANLARMEDIRSLGDRLDRKYGA